MFVVFVFIADSLGDGEGKAEGDFGDEADDENRRDERGVGGRDVGNRGDDRNQGDDRDEFQASTFGESHGVSLVN